MKFLEKRQLSILYKLNSAANIAIIITQKREKVE
jgi:hypothetical protein